MLKYFEDKLNFQLVKIVLSWLAIFQVKEAENSLGNTEIIKIHSFNLILNELKEEAKNNHISLKFLANSLQDDYQFVKNHLKESIKYLLCEIDFISYSNKRDIFVLFRLLLFIYNIDNEIKQFKCDAINWCEFYDLILFDLNKEQLYTEIKEIMKTNNFSDKIN